MKLYQQGDVLFKEADLPKGQAEEVKSRIVAEGEATGHHHRVAVSASVRVLQIKAGLYLVAREACRVMHEEHGEITIPPGTYVIDRVREYDHFAQEARQVVD